MKTKEKKESSKIIWIMYLILAVLIILYAIHNSIFIGIAAFAMIIIILIMEFRPNVVQFNKNMQSTDAKGKKRSLLGELRSAFGDIIIALGAAVGIWLILIVVLHTTAPIDAVASCSMLPNLHRGDLVVLEGISNMTSFLQQHKVPVVNVSQSQLSNMLNNIDNEYLAYFAYSPYNKSMISSSVNGTGYDVGLYNTKCITTDEFYGQENKYNQCFVPSSAQDPNLVKFNYSVGNVVINNVQNKIIYTSSITIANTTIVENYSNPIIVYRTTTGDYFSGDIIHRLYAAIHSGNQYYLLTKGDNNPSLDMEFANYPVNSSDAIGYVVTDIPVLGYVKLIISGQFATPAGCNQVILGATV